MGAKARGFVTAIWLMSHCGAAAVVSAAAADEPAPAGAAASDVGALGRLEPASEVIKLDAAGPDRLDQLTVKRGEHVSKGQVVGYLDSYAEQLAQQKLIEAQLDEARAQLAAQVELDNRRIADAEDRSKRVDEMAPQQIAAQTATVEAQQAVLDNNKNIFSSYTELVRRDAGSRRTRDDQETLVKQGEANLRAAQSQLNMLQRQYAFDRRLAENQIALAKAALESTRTSAPITSLTRRLELARVQVRRATLISPIDGRVLNIQVRPGEQVGQPDDKPILSLGGTDQMRVVAEVYETDIVRVRVGDKARITSPALAAPLAGEVVEIGDMIFKNDVLNLDPAARADARVVEVRIALDHSESVAKLTNLSVNVVIDTTERHPAGAAAK
jgi:HlyD family secretion protein